MDMVFEILYGFNFDLLMIGDTFDRNNNISPEGSNIRKRNVSFRICSPTR